MLPDLHDVHHVVVGIQRRVHFRLPLLNLHRTLLSRMILTETGFAGRRNDKVKERAYMRGECSAEKWQFFRPAFDPNTQSSLQTYLEILSAKNVTTRLKSRAVSTTSSISRYTLVINRMHASNDSNRSQFSSSWRSVSIGKIMEASKAAS